MNFVSQSKQKQNNKTNQKDDWKMKKTFKELKYKKKKKFNLDFMSSKNNLQNEDGVDIFSDNGTKSLKN